jgi:N-acyl-D-amino-acid deacylase
MKKTMTRRKFLKNSSKMIAAAGIGGYGILIQGCSSRKDFDLVIKGGEIFDGLGNDAFEADIGIKGNFITAIGNISDAKAETILDAKDLAVCPGFVDAHDHTDVHLLANPKAESSIRQGITTLVSGNCGSSPFPVAEAVYDEMKEMLKEMYQIDLNWTDITGFFSRLEESGIALNYASLVGQGTIRGAAMGFNDRPPSASELERMKSMVAENIEGGAVGLSSGLEYAPGSYAKAEEIEELCRVAAQHRGVYATHMRDEGSKLLESLEESIETAKRTGVSLQISHFKIAYPQNWHKVDEALASVEKANKDGVSIFCDRYPYIAGSTGLSYYFPLWAKQGTTDEFIARLKDPQLENRIRSHLSEQEKKLSSWDKVVISSVYTEKNKKFEGKSVLEGAKETGKRPYDFMRDLLVEEKNRVGMVTFMMTEENLKKILAHPLVGVGTDGSAIAPYGVLHRGKPHPRLYGTFPRVLGKYIREEKILLLPEMIKKITSLPAQKFGFVRRGVLKKEYCADVVVFDRDKVIDQATWTDPHQYPVGIEYVIVNGKVVIEKGRHTGNLPGKVLRKIS